MMLAEIPWLDDDATGVHSTSTVEEEIDLPIRTFPAITTYSGYKM